MAEVKRKKERPAAVQQVQAGGAASGAERTAARTPPASGAAGLAQNRTGAPYAGNNGYAAGGIASKEQAQNALAGARYSPGRYVQDAAQALREWQQSSPTGYTSAYQPQIDALLGQLGGREPFRYDYSADPLYQQYAKVYTQNARLASEDAAAQAAALTGGYGSSYAASAAQQAYQQQMDELNAIVPALYAQALNEYNDEGQALYDQLAAYTTQEQAAQDRYYRDVDLYNDRLDYLADAYNAAYAQDYGAYSDYLDALAGMRDYYDTQERYRDAQKQQAWENQMAEKEYQLAVQKAAASGTASGSASGGTGKTGTSGRTAAAKSTGKSGSTQGTGAAPEEKDGSAQTKAYAATPVSAVAKKLNGVQAALSNNARSASSIADAMLPVPYGAARARANGKSDAAIRKGLAAEGYNDEQIEEILRQL